VVLPRHHIFQNATAVITTPPPTANVARKGAGLAGRGQWAEDYQYDFIKT
jgi:hypothetical protein